MSIFADDRLWYDQFTSTDWVHDSIADSYRVKQLRARKDFYGRLAVLFDGAQGWILSAVVGFSVAVIAYCVNIAEGTVFDFKDGYCSTNWTYRERVSRCANLATRHLYSLILTDSTIGLLPTWCLHRLAPVVRGPRRERCWCRLDRVYRLSVCGPRLLDSRMSLDTHHKDHCALGLPHVHLRRESRSRSVHRQ